MKTPRWEIVVAWILRAAMLATGIIFIARGRWAFGAVSIAAVALAATPSLIAREVHFTWPIEIELALLWLVTAHVTLGYLFGLYDRVDFFDKALHFSDSALIGFVAFLAVFVGHYLRTDRSHRWLDGIAIFLFTLGIGAFWEIVEYAADQLAGAHTQGSPSMSALADTMWDLIVDGGGGVIAAIVGPIYMHHSRRSRDRAKQLADHLERRKKATSGRREVRGHVAEVRA